MFFLAALAALLLASTGCSYLEQRADDFLDCFKAGVGAGYGAEATARVGPLVGSVGAWAGTGAGWMGRHGAVTHKTVIVGMPFTNIVLPFVILVAGDLAHSASGGSARSYWYLFPLGVLGTTAALREYKEFPGDKEEIDFSLLFVDVIDLIRGSDGRVDDWRDYFWIGFSVHVFVGAEFAFNVAEFADFLLGWFGLDLAGDDDDEIRTTREERTAPPNHP